MRGPVSFFCMCFDSFLSIIFWRDYSFLWVFLAHLNSVSWPYIPGFNSGLSMLFHWLVCLFLYQYHTVFFYSFVVYFEIWKHGTAVFVLFSQDCFWLFKIFCDCTHISGLFYFCEECFWYFDGVCIEFVDGFE